MDIQQAKSYNIVLIGDSCDDIYHYGTCERLSPEAPVPVLKQQTQKKVKGMSWNVRLNLEAYDLFVHHFTNTEKICKHRFIDTRYNQHLLRWDEGEEKTVAPFNPDYLKMYGNVDAVVISDYNKGFLPNSVCKKIVEFYSSDKKIPIFVDSKKSDLSCFKNCFIKINEKEYNNITEHPQGQHEYVITLGSRGATYRDMLYDSEPVEVFDVCGAGDVFLSSLVYWYLETKDMGVAIPKANKMAAISVSHMGTYVLSKEDIDE